MGLTLEISIGDLQKASDQLQGIKLRTQDIREAGSAIRLLLQEDVDLRFQSSPATEAGGEVLGGEQWEALSPEYLLARPIRRNGQILRDTGELLQSMTTAGNPYEVFEVSETELVFGTALPKAVGLQRDRPFLFWHPALLEKVANYVARHIGLG